MIGWTKSILLLAFFAWLSTASAQKSSAAVDSISLNPEAISAKAFLEDLLSRRYSQELSSLVKKEFFNLGATLELSEVKKPESKDPDNEVAEEPISDLMIGQLDPESLIKKFAGTNQQASLLESFLHKYQVKSVSVTVGVDERLGPQAKADVEKWLKTRVATEFGSSGKTSIVTTKMPIDKEKEKELKKEEPSLWDKLEKFQTLAGQALFALCLLVGIILWKFLSGTLTLSASGDITSQASISSNAQVKTENIGEENPKVKSGNGGSAAAGAPAAVAEHSGLRRQLLQIAPKIKEELDSVTRSWCQMGDYGLKRLACFAEVVGQEFGRLPIPVDAMANVSKVFTQMIDMSLEEKNEHLQKAYWDLLAVLNLGADSLEKPFSYISQTKMPMMQEILINENVKMQTLVSMFMSSDQRRDYMQAMPDDKKMELLKSAAAFTEVETAEFKAMNQSLRNQLKPESNSTLVRLDMTLKKLAESISITDQIKFLPVLDHNTILDFKRSFPALAFIHEWPAPELQTLLAKTTADELVAYLSLKSDQKTKFIDLCPTFTAEVVRDEMQNPPTLAPDELEGKLQLFTKRLVQMINSGDIILEELFVRNEEELQNSDSNKTSVA